MSALTGWLPPITAGLVSNRRYGDHIGQSIPGNEKLVTKTVDLLFKQGAEVVYERNMGVHVSDAAQED